MLLKRMKFHSKYSAPIRPVFRIPAIIIGAAQLIFGCVYLIDGGFKVGLPQTIVGLMFLTAGIRGQLPKWLDSEEREDEISEGNLGTRRLCLISLGALLLVLLILVTMFLTAEWFSIGWWAALLFSLITVAGFYINSTILLKSKGFHPLLALTFVFPVILLVIGIINPRKFEQINVA